MNRKFAQFKDDNGRWQELPINDYRVTPEIIAMESSKTGMTTRVVEYQKDGELKVLKVFKIQRKNRR